MSGKEGNPKAQYAGIPAEKKTAAYSKAYYDKNTDKRRADAKIRSAKFRKENPEEAKQRAHYSWHSKTKEERSAISTERRLKGRFKRSTEWYAETLAIQGVHCALCSAVPSTRRFHVDHDHACCPCVGTRYTCGKCVRGILCDGCNTRLGYLENVLKEGTIVPNPNTWTEKALQYLDQYGKTQEG